MELPPKEEGVGAIATEKMESEPRADDGVISAAAPPSAGDVEDEGEDEDDEVKRIRARTRFLYQLKKSGLDEDDDEHADEVERRRLEEGDDEGGGASVVFRRASATPAPDDYEYRFWDDEMEGMLELRVANPVWDDGTDAEEEGGHSRNPDWRVDRSTRTQPIPWSGRIVEGERGFKIR